MAVFIRENLAELEIPYTFLWPHIEKKNHKL